MTRQHVMEEPPKSHQSNNQRRQIFLFSLSKPASQPTAFSTSYIHKQHQLPLARKKEKICDSNLFAINQKDWILLLIEEEKRERERVEAETEMGTLETWRKAYGSLKDHTKVGLAHVNSDFKVPTPPFSSVYFFPIFYGKLRSFDHLVTGFPSTVRYLCVA